MLICFSAYYTTLNTTTSSWQLMKLLTQTAELFLRNWLIWTDNDLNVPETVSRLVAASARTLSLFTARKITTIMIKLSARSYLLLTLGRWTNSYINWIFDKNWKWDRKIVNTENWFTQCPLFHRFNNFYIPNEAIYKSLLALKHFYVLVMVHRQKLRFKT